MNVSWEKMNDWQTEYIDFYCRENMKELKKLCDPILISKNIPNMYHEDLYGIAVDCLGDSLMNFDNEKAQFKTFLSGNIKRKFNTWMRDSTRACRCNVQKDENGKIVVDDRENNVVIHDVSIYSTNEDGLSLEDLIISDYDLEEESLNSEDGLGSQRIKDYMNTLGKQERKIAQFLMDGYKPEEIKQQMNLTDKEYDTYLKDMRSYEKKKSLVREVEANSNENVKKIIKESAKMGTSEKTKNTSYSIESISKKLRSYQVRDNHILQRPTGQWNVRTTNELISDILQGKSLTQIIISEEIKGNIRMLWLIDGKQRCTALDMYLHDEFAVSKNVKVYMIEYQTNKKDADGNILLSAEGFPIPETKVCDIRGKKFSQLPEELQDRFKEYQVPVMLNLNCTKRDIAYDMSRFNRCRPMNKAQNGWTGFDEDFAELVDNILKMDFFKPDCSKSKYTASNEKSGALRRMIVESVMVSEFMHDYTKDFVEMCEYLTDNANENLFIDAYENIDALTDILTEETADMFNVKNTFLWLALYNKFLKYDVEKERFSDFMIALKQDLHSKEVDGTSFDKLEESKRTKDKTVVKKKMEILEKLLCEFLGVELMTANDPCEFLQENVSKDINESDVEFYEKCLEDCTVEIDSNSKLLDQANKDSMLAICAYSCQVDEDLEDWLIDFSTRANTYFVDQKRNFQVMKEDFNRYKHISKAA